MSSILRQDDSVYTWRWAMDLALDRLFQTGRKCRVVKFPGYWMVVSANGPIRVNGVPYTIEEFREWRATRP